MLQDLAWHTTDTLTRNNLAMLQKLGDEIGLTQDDMQSVLGLSKRVWLAWTHFVADSPAPAEPPMAEMLRRVAESTHTLLVVRERINSRTFSMAPATG